MSDYLTREFGALLNTTMELVLKRAIFEIMKIFENSIHDHQLELTRKGEEIVQLKVKLQKAEIQLRESAGNTRQEINIRQKSEDQRDNEEALNTSRQSSSVPEINFEVPDEWCAPVACETKPDTSACPSVRLREFSIPLWNIPVVKLEMASQGIGPKQLTTAGKKSEKGLLSNKKSEQTNDQLLQEQPALKSGTGLEKKVENPSGSEKDHPPKRKKEETASAATESHPQIQEMDDNGAEKKYKCKFCEKVFRTKDGRHLHLQSHKTCRGCKRQYDFPRGLARHKATCPQLKEMMSKGAESFSASEHEPSDDKKLTTPAYEMEITEKDGVSSHTNNSKKLGKINKRYRIFHCGLCPEKFKRRYALQDHMLVHTGERPFKCGICFKKYRVSTALKVHMTKIHKKTVMAEDSKEDLEWTKPLESTEEAVEDLIPPCESTEEYMEDLIPPCESTEEAVEDVIPPCESTEEAVEDLIPPCESTEEAVEDVIPPINDTPVSVINVKNEDSRAIMHGRDWHKCGTKCRGGYICKVCSRFKKTRNQLIEHYRIHSGHKPFKCDNCGYTYRFRGQIYLHRKSCGRSKLQCEKCDKTFKKQEKYEEHLSKFHQEWPVSCDICGQGFSLVGYLRRHMETIHSSLEPGK